MRLRGLSAPLYVLPDSLILSMLPAMALELGATSSEPLLAISKMGASELPSLIIVLLFLAYSKFAGVVTPLCNT